jgi:TPR repeat protein
MGGFYAQGRGVTNDVVEALRWWQKAAQQGQVEAQATLGQLYLIPAAPFGTNYLNYPEALRWLRLAADQGSAGALNNLGVAYEHGFGVKRDFTEAAKWYYAAAARGNVSAQANLGQLYYYGQGVTNDLVQAYAWLRLSASQGNPLGRNDLATLPGLELLTPEQEAEASRKILDFKKKLRVQP